MGRRSGIALAGATRAVLVALVIGSFASPDFVDYSQRGTYGRAAASAVALAVVPVWWLVIGRRGKRGYPYAIDALLPVPLIVDYLARAYDWADHGWWDVAIHAFNWALLALVISLVLIRLALTREVAAVICLGIGATAAIVWELLEYGILQPERTGDRYVNTLQDLAVGLGATAFVAALVLVVSQARR